MKIKYYWDFSIEEFRVFTCDSLLIDYFEVNKKVALQTISQIGTMHFIQIVAKLNQLDEKLKLLFYYIKNATDIKLNSIEIIELIEKEHRLFFKEELDLKLEKEILDCSLLFISEDSINNFLWDIDLTQYFQKELKMGSRADLLEAYFSLLKVQAQKFISSIDSHSFYDIYPQLLLVDCKCETVIELCPFINQYDITEREAIHMIETEIEQIHHEKFLSMFLENESYSLKMQTIVPEGIALLEV